MRKIPVNVHVNDTMQRGYRYVLTEPVGRNFDPEFRPELTPKQMLALGIFCGKYMTDCRKEFPASWLANARLSSCRDCSSTTSALMQANRCQFGERTDGYIPTIHAAGFSGIVDITWGGAYRVRTHARLSAGKQFDDMSRRLGGIASPAIPRDASSCASASWSSPTFPRH